jgi:hypothetical protein
MGHNRMDDRASHPPRLALIGAHIAVIGRADGGLYLKLIVRLLRRSQALVVRPPQVTSGVMLR